MLAQPFFFDELDWIPIPKDFKLNTVVGKTYDTREGEGRGLWERVAALLRTLQPLAVAEPQSEMFGEPVLVRPRLGQGSFRVLVTDTYRRRCAVTGEKALPVLEAAHIQLVAEGGQHQIANGLLLRSDIHTLFDRGYISVTPAAQDPRQPEAQGGLRQRRAVLPARRPRDLAAAVALTNGRGGPRAARGERVPRLTARAAQRSWSIEPSAS